MPTGTPNPDLFEPTGLQDQLARARATATEGDELMTLALWSPEWTDEALRRLRGELTGGERRRRLLFVEPTAGLGWRRVVQLAAGPLLRRRLGHDFRRDVPVALRRAGFAIDTLDRFGVGLGGVRTYVRGVAAADPG
ncbi:MAG: hypothetical protein OEV40_14195 [Acidimicrobiia bacterium]|nr:hypothetical protein [Acidimicrobiia bacterium]